MPFADSQGVRIHYEVEGQGPPLVLQHGFAVTLDHWYYNGYVDALGSDYRLILIDARGHGASDKPHDPQAYRMQLMAGDVIAVLDELGIDKARYFGYSMGGAIGFALAKWSPERLASLIIGGANPYEEDPDEPSPWREATATLLGQGAQAFIESAMPEKYRNRFSAEQMDAEALIACLSLRERVGLADDLESLSVPCLLYCGESDPSYAEGKRCVDSMLRATFAAIPGTDHVEALARSDLVLPHVKRFLAGIALGQLGSNAGATHR
jgi:pimeloyl-ACP methyl ester carboxylesterase